MWRYVLALAFVCACGSEEEAEAPADAAETAPSDASDAPAEEERSALDQARDLAVAGDMTGALDAAKALLEADSTDAGAWRLLRYSAVHSDNAASVAAELPAGAGPFLATELLLAGGDAAGAMKSAKALQGSNPNGAAALMARAAMAGAPVGELEAGAALSLVSFATASDAKGARSNAEAAKAVGGWRAALLRGDVAKARGQWAMAFQEYGTAAKSDKKQAIYAGNVARLGLAAEAGKVLVKGKKPVPAKRASQQARWADKALDLAAAEGWGKDLRRDARTAVHAHIQAGSGSGALTAANTAFERVAADSTAAAGLGLMVARAALAAGDPVTAVDAATTARDALTAAGSAKPTARANWLVGKASFALGRLDDTQAASDQLDGPRQEVLRALVAMGRGQMKNAENLFPATGLDPADAAYAYQLAARTGSTGAKKWLDMAIVAADKAGAMATRVEARLAKESLIRGGNAKQAATLRAEIGAMAGEGTAGDGLRAELAVRSLLAGAPKGFPAGDGLPAVVGAWKALAAKGKPPKTDVEADKGVTHWARGRAAAAAGNLEGHDAQFQQALGKFPLHRMGELGSVTVLDGSEGVDVDTDIGLLSKMKTEAAVGMSLMAHEVGHRSKIMRRDRSLGRTPVSEVDQAAKETLLSTAAAVRSAVLEWMVSGGAWPSETFVSLAEAEAEAGKNYAFSSVLPSKGSSNRELRDALGTGAVLSLHVSKGQVHAVAFARNNRAMKNLGAIEEIRALAKAHVAAMAMAASKKGKTAHASGDLLRKKLLDPLHGDMVGVGKYVVVGPPDITNFAYNTLPEQAEGLRWLADIRKTTVAPTISALTRALPDKDQNTYNLDFLGFGTDTSSLNEALLTENETQNEIKTCSRFFSSGHDESLMGEDATVAAWSEKAARARYIHFSDLEAGPGGGFKMADGNLSLNQIRNTQLYAHLVVITARTNSPQQMQRARAFLDAGAEWVLVAAWDVPDRARVKLLSGIYDSMNQERPPARAMAEGRRGLFKDLMIGVDNDDPSLWGGLLLFGNP